MNLYAFVFVMVYLSLSTLYSSSYYANIVSTVNDAIKPPSIQQTNTITNDTSVFAPIVNAFNGLENFFNWILMGLTWAFQGIVDFVLVLLVLPFSDGGYIWGLMNGIVMMIAVYIIIDAIHGFI